MDNISNELMQQEQKICDEVKKQIFNNPILRGEDLLVSAEGDTVILNGFVGSLDKKWLAEDIARGTFGVLNVTNEIHVHGTFDDEQKGGFYEDF